MKASPLKRASSPAFRDRRKDHGERDRSASARWADGPSRGPLSADRRVSYPLAPIRCRGLALGYTLLKKRLAAWQPPEGRWLPAIGGTRHYPRSYLRIGVVASRGDRAWDWTAGRPTIDMGSVDE